MSAPVIVAFCTCPDDASAERLARALVERRLAACVNRLSAIRSVYRWQGQLTEDDEVLLVIKTTHRRFAALADAVRELHPYDVPELLAFPVDAGLPDYLGWVEQCTEES